MTGPGAIGRVEYLRGSQYEASGYFLPSPAPRAFPPERSIIAPGWIEPVFQTPPLFAFPFEFPDCGFLAVGLAAQKRENLFDQFEYTPFAEPYTLVNLRAAWSTDLRGYRTADGALQLPDLIFHFAATPYDALRAYAETLYAAYGCVRRPAKRPPRWHLGPFFCGWGQQYEYADQDPKSAATQRCYTEMTDELERKQIRPRAIMIDDKWMRNYGTLEPDPDKWPDLRGFVERQHARNCKVLLWIPCWKTEGLDVAECGTLHSDRICADPTAPAYRARIERTFARLLGDGPGDFNCDGFKIDFANQPAPMRVPGVRTVGGLAGMKLTKALFALFYRCAKAVKPDALLNHSAAHPAAGVECGAGRSAVPAAGTRYEMVRTVPFGQSEFRLVSVQKQTRPEDGGPRLVPPGSDSTRTWPKKRGTPRRNANNSPISTPVRTNRMIRISSFIGKPCAAALTALTVAVTCAETPERPYFLETFDGTVQGALHRGWKRYGNAANDDVVLVSKLGKMSPADGQLTVDRRTGELHPTIGVDCWFKTRPFEGASAEFSWEFKCEADSITSCNMELQLGNHPRQTARLQLGFKRIGSRIVLMPNGLPSPSRNWNAIRQLGEFSLGEWYRVVLRVPTRRGTAPLTVHAALWKKSRDGWGPAGEATVPAVYLLEADAKFRLYFYGGKGAVLYFDNFRLQ